MPRHRLIAALWLLVFVLPAVAQKPGKPIRPGFNLFSKQQDVQLGQEAAAEIRKQIQVVENRELQDYIQRIGKRLAAQPEADEFPYTFEMVNDRAINAFALPGGPTFMNTGLLIHADNEAQVAGVVAHEIAHVALRHGTNQVSKANFLQLPAIIAGIATGSQLWAGLAQLGSQTLLLKYSRTAETQADILGARMMAKAGYNPIEAARFFEKLESEGGSRAPQFLSSHPNPGNRVKSIEAEVRVMPSMPYNTAEGDFARMKRLAQQLPEPKGAQQQQQQQGQAAPAPGVSAPPAAVRTPREIPNPSSRFRSLSGTGWVLNHPDNWQVLGDRSQGSITIAPQEGVVENGLACGVIVSTWQAPNPRANLRTMTRDLIADLRRTNPDLNVGRDQRRTRLDGQEALVTEMRTASPLGGQELVQLVTVQRDRGLFYMVLVSPQSEYARFRPAFEQTLLSVRFSN
ncbi:MAG: M48 family metalloprotease [Bryobacterales bacterium]|nr:M48 family metalloprotease [Bryobacterales bacterium]